MLLVEIIRANQLAVCHCDVINQVDGVKPLLRFEECLVLYQRRRHLAVTVGFLGDSEIPRRAIPVDG